MEEVGFFFVRRACVNFLLETKTKERPWNTFSRTESENSKRWRGEEDETPITWIFRNVFCVRKESMMINSRDLGGSILYIYNICMIFFVFCLVSFSVFFVHPRPLTFPGVEFRNFHAWAGGLPLSPLVGDHELLRLQPCKSSADWNARMCKELDAEHLSVQNLKIPRSCNLHMF